MSQIIPSEYLLISKTLDLQGYLKYQHFAPPLHRNVKLTKEHNQKKSIRSGRSVKRSGQQRRTRLINIGLCNLVHCTDGYLKHWTYTTADPFFDKKLLTRHFTDFIRRLERVLHYKPLYMAVLEQHDSEVTGEDKRYSYHIHCLFFNLPYYSQLEMTKKWGLGRVWVTPYSADSGYSALNYVLKYLTKENTLNDRIMMPRGMLRPTVEYNLPRPLLTPIYTNATFILEANVTITSSLYKKIKT